MPCTQYITMLKKKIYIKIQYKPNIEVLPAQDVIEPWIKFYVVFVNIII